jgi:hypothetical protein
MSGQMWYRAARYDTLEECQEFYMRLRANLELRPEADDDLVTLDFGVPNGAYYAVAMGFPAQSTIDYANLLFENPPALLSREEIEFAKMQIVKLRRDSGVSDEVSRDYAREKLRAMGAPDAALQTILRDYAEATPDLSLPKPKKNVPWIAVYREQQSREIDHVMLDENPYEIVENTFVTGNIMKKLNDLKLARSEKYQFGESAMKMLETVFSPDKKSWVTLPNHLWIEFLPQSISNEHGEDIRMLWVHRMDMEADINNLVQKNSTVGLALQWRNTMYKHLWSFNVITSQGREYFDFTYDEVKKDWVYPASHICPWKECTYPKTEFGLDPGRCDPCRRCLAAFSYWSAMLHAAIRMVRREFALLPQEPRPFEVITSSYTEETQVKVGKGKNAKKIKKEVKREVEYRFVTYEVSEFSSEERRTSKEALEQEHPGNWLTFAEPKTVIWEYKTINTSKGRTLDPERNPRWKKYQHMKILPFKRWVPMYTKEIKTIKRVSAQRFKS